MGLRIHPPIVMRVVLGAVLFVGAIAITHTAITRPQVDASQPAYTQRTASFNLKQTWVVSATEAKTLIDEGATLLDARGNLWFGRNQVSGSVPVSWPAFSPKHKTQKGNLLESNAVLTQTLQKLGISKNRPVVVFANPSQGWGEDGRIVWMLRTLGHQQAVIVDGGYAALAQENLVPPSTPLPGNFVVQRDFTWQIQPETLKAELNNPNQVIIDTRTPQEYAGATPHGEQRRGHIPGAIHLHFRSLLTQQGTLLPRDQILAKLQTMGITQDTEIVAYCTGGIRSGWLTVVLADLGFQVKNYAGSMWEWSAESAQEYPLTVQS